MNRRDSLKAVAGAVLGLLGMRAATSCRLPPADEAALLARYAATGKQYRKYKVYPEKDSSHRLSPSSGWYTVTLNTDYTKEVWTVGTMTVNQWRLEG